MDSTTATTPAATEQKLVRGLGLLDSTMLVAGSMIGSGIFIVSTIIARQVGAPGWLLVVWIVTGVLTLMAALSYGELAAMMPKAGGQYVYLREAFSPLWGFLYGWTLFLVIQTGTIAAVAVGFARYMGVLVPWVSESNYLIQPIRLGGYAISLSTAQLVGLLLIALLTFIFPISGVCVADCKKLERASPRQLGSACLSASASRKRTRSFLLMRGTISPLPPAKWSTHGVMFPSHWRSERFW